MHVSPAEVELSGNFAGILEPINELTKGLKKFICNRPKSTGARPAFDLLDLQSGQRIMRARAGKGFPHSGQETSEACAIG